ncbi:MAG: sugar ABC transporter permease [Clostridiaceae bacterium]|nr:sugar ABC transporter permease [Clostridiaceae bacterium]
MEKSDIKIIEEEKSFKQKLQPWGYLLPTIVILTIFMFIPFFQTIIRSLFFTDNFGKMQNFIGFGNYIELLTSSSFWNSVWVSFRFVLIVVLVGVVLGFVSALLTQKAFPGLAFFSTSYATPMAIASVGMALIFQVMLNPSVGIINKILGAHGNMLADPGKALIIVAILTAWLNSGMNYLYFSSGLASISDSQYEAASIDGANGFQQFMYITVPALRPTTFFVIVTNIINAFQSFGQINILTKGGPGEATNVIVFDIYREAFMNYRYGFASAESVILFLIILALTILMFYIRSKGGKVQ